MYADYSFLLNYSVHIIQETLKSQPLTTPNKEQVNCQWHYVHAHGTKIPLTMVSCFYVAGVYVSILFSIKKYEHNYLAMLSLSTWPYASTIGKTEDINLDMCCTVKGLKKRAGKSCKFLSLQYYWNNYVPQDLTIRSEFWMTR